MSSDFPKPSAKDLRENARARRYFIQRHFGPNDIEENRVVTSDNKDHTHSWDVHPDIPWGSLEHPEDRRDRRNKPSFGDR